MNDFPAVGDLEITLYGLAGTKSMILTEAADLKIETQLQGLHELSFRIRRDDPKSNFIIADTLIGFEGVLYRTRDYEDEHPTIRTIKADARWIELTWITKPGPVAILGKTPEQGVTEILKNSGWTQVNNPINATLYSAERIDATVLEYLRAWAAITGYEIKFDTVNKTVEFVSEIGENKGVGFSYGHNLKNLKRTYRPPQATRIYPYGANDLNVSTVNPTGQLYIEDYSWYVAQGLTLIQAKAQYRKDFTWVDDTFLTELALYDAAVAYLAQLAQPSIQYSGDVINLSRLTESDADDFGVGDYVLVNDELLGVEVSTRVVRLVTYPTSPGKDTIELAYLNEGLVEAATGGDRTTDYNSVAMVVDTNTDPLTITGSTTNWGEINITSTGQGTYVVGGHFIGVASGTGTVSFSFRVDGNPYGGTKTLDFVDGQQVEYSWPSFAGDVEEGSHTITWTAQVTSGTGTIAVPIEQARAWLLTRGAVGVGVVNTPSQFISETVEALDDLGFTYITTEAYTVEMNGSTWLGITPNRDREEGETLAAAETLVTDVTDRFLMPFTVGDPVFGTLDGPGVLSPPD